MLISAFAPVLPSAATTFVFSNLNEAVDGNITMRSNIAAGIMLTSDGEASVTQVRLKMGTVTQSGVETIKARFYTSVSNKPSSFFGQLDQSSFDSVNRIATFTGSVQVPAGDFWMIFQCQSCANQELARSASLQKSGAWTHIRIAPADPKKPTLLTQSYSGGSGLISTNSSFAWDKTILFEIEATPTADTTPPTLANSVPADNSTSVLPNSNLQLNFSEDVVAGSGNIYLHEASNPSSPIQVVPISDTSVDISGSVVTVDWPIELDQSTDYFVLMDVGLLQDTSGNLFAGISSPATLNFTTIGPPALSSSTPADGAASVPNNANLVLNFSRNVTAVAGKNLTLVNTLDPSDNRVIAADDAQVSISGSAVTINPTADLRINSSYAVTFDAGAFVDGNSIPVNELSDLSALNFSTSKFPFSGLTAALDASDLSSYPGNGTKWTDISGTGNHVELKSNPTFVSNVGEPKAFEFNGTSQYGVFETGGQPILDLLNKSAYTKLVWFKPEGFNDNNNLVSASGKAAHALWGGGNKAECSATGDNLASGHNGGQWRQVQADTCLETAWQMMAVTFTSDPDDPNAGWRIYRNGDLVGSSTILEEIDAANDGYSTRIASYNQGYFFEGQIAKVLIYERPLASSEVDGIFEAGKAEFNLALSTVTFDANGGTVDTPTLRTNQSGEVSLRSPTKANADFLGWFTAPTGGTKVGDAGDSYTPQADVTLFAQWDSVYTVTYSAGTNAGGAPANATFQESVGAITLPTPTRADYVFEGWFTAATGGTKIGNAGAAYTPNADLTLHGQWTQASLAGIPASDRTLVNTAVMTNGVGSTNTLAIGSSSVAVSIPGDAFATGVEVRTYSVANHNRAQAMLPNESDFVNSIVVAWTAPDTTVPIANSPLQIVITDANIKEGAKVYSILGDQTTLLATATQDGTVTIFFTVDPLITIANPVVAPPATQTPIGGFVAPVVPEADAESDVDEAPAVARGWTRAMADGTVKFYARDLVGAGKVRFMLNGREIAWVRAADASDPKLNVGPAAARDGLVRTVGPGSRWSLVDGRNVLEIYVGENRLVRRIFTQ
jgi:uncharacterized repeat protein (TIGR02543 family)